jgi:integrase/recombinase XerD
MGKPIQGELVKASPAAVPAVIERKSAGDAVPEIVAESGGAACFAWDEYFSGSIRNTHTRRAYAHAVRQFLAWVAGKGLPLGQITPGLVGQYLDQHPGTIPTKKQHLAAIRGFFDALVLRHAVLLNPASSVRAARYQVIEGKTPEITIDQARTLLKLIDTGNVVGLRDRAVIAILIYTAARIGAVAGLKRGSLVHDGSQFALRFSEKGGKEREIPLHHDLERFLMAWIDAAGLKDAPKESPLFRTVAGKTKTLTANGPTAGDLGRMVKRRMKETGLPDRLSPHSFRVATITDLLHQGEALEDVQHLAGHSDARTTRLYDRRQKVVTRKLVERISV